jgi:hypothetical protein
MHLRTTLLELPKFEADSHSSRTGSAFAHADIDGSYEVINFVKDRAFEGVFLPQA